MAKYRKLIWSLISLVLAALTIATVLSQLGEMPLRQLGQTIREADDRYLAAAAVCGALFLFFAVSILWKVAGALLS